MAVVSVTEQRAAFSGSLEYRGAEEAARAFVIVANSTITSMEAIRQACLLGSNPLPSYGDALESGSPLVVRNYDIQESDDGNWEVVVTYRPRDPLDFDDETETIKAPEERPAKLSWSYIERAVVREQDIEGNAYKNSAGDPLDQPPMFIIPVLVVSVTQYQEAFNPATLMDYVGATNSALFLGAAADTLRMKPASATREFVPGYFDEEGEWQPGTFYYNVTYQFEYNPEQWQPVDIADRGPRVLNANGDPILVTDANGVATGKTVYLDGGRNAKAPGADVHYLQFRPFRQMDFNNLNLKV